MADNIFRKEARIEAAENGLILRWTEYVKSEKAYDGVQYVGGRSKLFSLDEGQACVDELVAIDKEEKEHNASCVKSSTFG